jgi:hypothetical protein
MKWKKATLAEACEFMQGKIIDNNGTCNPPNWDCDVVVFTDGSAVACESKWSGPLSEVTPDIDADSPVFYLGTP